MATIIFVIASCGATRCGGINRVVIAGWFANAMMQKSASFLLQFHCQSQTNPTDTAASDANGIWHRTVAAGTAAAWQTVTAIANYRSVGEATQGHLFDAH